MIAAHDRTTLRRMREAIEARRSLADDLRPILGVSADAALLALKAAETAEIEVESYEVSFRLYERASRALMAAYKRAHPDVPESVWPDTTKVNVWAADEIARRDTACVAALKLIVDRFGPFHDDDCPGDDTCSCSAKPLNDEINEVLAE